MIFETIVKSENFTQDHAISHILVRFSHLDMKKKKLNEKPSNSLKLVLSHFLDRTSFRKDKQWHSQFVYLPALQ